MKSVIFGLVLLVLTSSVVFADDLKLADGQVYRGFSVSAVNENGVVVTFDNDKMATVPFAQWPAAMNNKLGRFKDDFDRLSKVAAPAVTTTAVSGSPGGGKTASQLAKEKEKQMAEVMAQGVPVYIRDASLKNVRGVIERHYDKTGCGISDGKFIIIGGNIYQYEKDKVQSLDKVIADLESKQKTAAANVEKVDQQIDDCKNRLKVISSRRDGRQTVRKNGTTTVQKVYSNAQENEMKNLNRRISDLKDNLRDEKKKTSQYANDLKEFQNSLQTLERNRKRICDKYALPIKPVDLFSGQ